MRQTGQSENSSEPFLTHVAIPARYRSGVTLYALTNSETWIAISESPEIDEALASLASESSNRADYDENAPSSVVITMDDNSFLSPENPIRPEDEDQFSSEEDNEVVDGGNFDNGEDEHGESSQSCSAM